MTIFVQVTTGAYALPTLRPFDMSMVGLTEVESTRIEMSTHVGWRGVSLNSVVSLYGSGFEVGSIDYPYIDAGTITSISSSVNDIYYDIYGTSYSIHGGTTAITGISIGAVPFLDVYLNGSRADFYQALFTDAVVFNASDSIAVSVVGTTTIRRNVADEFAGSAFNDVLIGRNGNDTLNGMGGDDYINGGNDNDALLGGDGADLIYGGAGDDSIWSGSGSNIVLAGDGNDTIFGDGGDDVLYGEAGNDVLLAGAGASFAVGGAGDDHIWGEAGADYLMGDDGDDVVFAGSGDDAVVAGSGADELYGGDGVDALYGGTGSDLYFGGAGTDFFYIHADGPTAGEIDIVADFAATGSGAPDYLVLSSAFHDGTIVYADTTYTWVATAVTGGFHYVALTNTSPDIVAAQIIWV